MAIIGVHSNGFVWVGLISVICSLREKDRWRAVEDDQGLAS